MASPNTSGQTPLPNEIQNTQTQSANYDSSHIICGANGIPSQIEIKGDVVLSPGSTLIATKIVATDLLCGIEALPNGFINAGGTDRIDFNFTNQINLSAGATVTTNAYTNQINVTDNALTTVTNTINTVPSSQYYISYGQSKGENETSLQYTITYPNPEVGQPDITMELFGYPNVAQWYDNIGFNPIDNPYIVNTGNTFRFICPDTTAVEIEITWQLRYVFDGTQPTDYFAIGLFNQSDNVIVPQSLQWQVSNDKKHKWQTFKTSFMMSSTQQDYFPFFQQQTGSNNWVDSEAGGFQRSSIKFKFYQFVNY